MTTSQAPRSTTWTAVRPGVWRDSTKISNANATEIMARHLEKAGMDEAAKRVRRRGRKTR